MGDPKRRRKQYQTPKKPWNKVKIEEDYEIKAEYGFVNKKEIWCVESTMQDFKTRAKNLISITGEKGIVEKQKLISKLNKMGILNETATIEDVLSLTFRNFADRRLQSLVFRKGLARSVKQARQFITHLHIKVGDKKITAPSYNVLREQEDKISFAGTSPFSNSNHPEISIEKKSAKVVKAHETKATIEESVEEPKVEASEEKE
ncbi:MAG: 30S ribosomal protein S4 [Candidatus Woesearchaeota archaeon]|jgi:small subunit ribosomal protein S4